MQRFLSEQLRRLGEIFPNSDYIANDDKLLKESDLLLFREIHRYLPQVREALIPFSAHLTDLGGGRNPFRWLALKNFQSIASVDPIYSQYQTSEWEAEKERLFHNLRQTLKDVQPVTINAQQPTTIEGFRNGQAVKVSLVPKTGVEWLQTVSPEALPAISLWRVFPSEDEWLLILSKLKPGGLLMTTGEGISSWDNRGLFDLGAGSFGGGANIYNSHLPADGNYARLGIEPLLPELELPYFYRKV